MALVALLMPAMTRAEAPAAGPVAKKILFIGDSMTGWLSERLEAYGKANGFEVATVVWDGSTIKKWGSSTKLPSLVKQENPDAVFVSLGMNDLFEKNPGVRFKSSLDAIKAAVGNRPILWVGPPSWPGRGKGETVTKWLNDQLGAGHYFNSSDLTLPRQSAKNPHPTKAGMSTWVDALVEWMPANSAIKLPGYRKPTGQQMLRGKTFIYKRMKETL